MPRYKWDVFLSHNGRQKAWVRSVADQLEHLKLRVFLDERSIGLGSDSVQALEDGIEHSRFIALVITPESMRSRWVTLESSLVMYADPDAQKGRLIPILLHPTDEQLIRPGLRRLTHVDLTNSETRQDAYSRFLQHLGVPAANVPGVPRLPPKERITSPACDSLTLDMDHGAIRPPSQFYVERDTDRSIRQHLLTSARTIIVKGYRKSGKSSLLAALHSWALHTERPTCHIDFQSFSSDDFSDPHRLFYQIADVLNERLKLNADPDKSWSERRGAKRSLTRYIEQNVFPHVDSRLQLLIDEADRVFDARETCQELFSLLRAWDGLRATRPEAGWGGLDLVVAHATNPADWIDDYNQSLFNVGFSVALPDFSENQVKELNRRHGEPLTTKAEIQQLMAFVGGHPYLVRLSLYSLASCSLTLKWLLDSVKNEDGPFAAVLRQAFRPVVKKPALRTALRQVLAYGRCDNDWHFQWLWSLGLVSGDGGHDCRFRCKVYEDWYTSRL